jgi:zinc protease
MFRSGKIVLAWIMVCIVSLTPLSSQVTAQNKMIKVNFKERTLKNGLRFYSIEDHASPTVAIHVWYHVGGKDDPANRSGFAHLFEHLMFKSTRNMKSEMMDRLTEDVGGENNAFTTSDATVYHETVPSNYLQTLIWAESDRLASLVVDDANFKSERSVVEEEFRQGILAPPYGKLEILTEDKSWAKHPYKQSVIGRIEDLEASTLQDVQQFHSTYYRPDNATLVVAGDFDQKQLDSWVDQYFGRIPKPNAPLPRVGVKEPERTAENRYVEYNSNVPLPAVVLTYLAPSAASRDAYALKIADTVLSNGTSSRLYQSLIYSQQVAQEAECTTDLREDAGLITFRLTLASEKKPEEGEKALLAEIKRMQDQQVSPAELLKAKNQIVTEQLRELQTNDGKAHALGNAAVLLGDPNRINTDIKELEAVTAADVQRVTQKYMTEKNRVVIYYQAEKSDGSK